MKPDPSTYRPDPDYLRELCDSTGLSRAAIARDVLGVSERCLYLWLAGDRDFPYTAQFTLEVSVLGV